MIVCLFSGASGDEEEEDDDEAAFALAFKACMTARPMGPPPRTSTVEGRLPCAGWAGAKGEILTACQPTARGSMRAVRPPNQRRILSA